MKIIVYSCNPDNNFFKDLSITNRPVSYLYFSNRNHISNKWKVIPIDSSYHNKDSEKVISYFKMNPHLVLPPHDISIWVDPLCRIRFTDPVKMILNFLGKKDISCYKFLTEKNVDKNCIYRDNEDIYDHLLRYKKVGFPRNFGMFNSDIIIRRNNDKVRNLNELWWREVNLFSLNEDIAFPFSIWKSQSSLGLISQGTINSNPYIERVKKIERPVPIKKEYDTITTGIYSKKVTICIVEYNNKEQVDRILNEIFTRTLGLEDYELILVDNNPIPVRSRKDKRIKTIFNKNINQLSGAVNKAIDIAKGEFFLYVCGNHVHINSNDWLNYMLNGIKDGQIAGSVTPYDGTVHVQGGLFIARTQLMKDFKYDEIKFPFSFMDVDQCKRMLSAGINFIELPKMKSVMGFLPNKSKYKIYHSHT